MVAADRLRFDFTLDRGLTAEEISSLETTVNAEIVGNAPLETRLMSVDDAKRSGAVALFGEKYPEPVRVVTVGEYSRELCGGTHCAAAGDIGSFRITAESSIAAGIRRVEGVTGTDAVAAMQEDRAILTSLGRHFGVAPTELVARVEKLNADLKELRKQAKQAARAAPAFDATEGEALEGGGVQVYVHLLERPRDEVVAAAEALVKRPGDAVAALLVTRAGGKIAAVAAGNQAAQGAGFDAAGFIRAAGGRGGGRPHLAQGTFPGDPTLESLQEGVRTALAALGT